LLFVTIFYRIPGADLLDKSLDFLRGKVRVME
ncbi:unnamed protein product, partial [Larinioides sclopetarius]